MHMGVTVSKVSHKLLGLWWSRGPVANNAVHEQMRAIFFDVVEAKHIEGVVEEAIERKWLSTGKKYGYEKTGASQEKEDLERMI